MENPGLTRELKHTLKKIMHCRTIDLGGHILHCPDHHAFSVLYNSCRQRGCPQCNEHRRLQWHRKKLKQVLPVEHIHLVFKFPAELSLLWLLNKKAVGDILLASVKKTIEQLRLTDGLMRGVINVLHTTGRNLAYHPHVHCLVTAGGMGTDQEWKRNYPAQSKLESTYRQAVKTGLIAGLQNNRIKPPAGKQESINLIALLAGREWDIFKSEIYTNSAGVTGYLAKHIRGMAVDDKQIALVSNEVIEIQQEHEGSQVVTRLKPLDFVMRYLNHIPPKGMVMVRSLGLYAARQSKSTLELRQRLSGTEQAENPEEPVEKKNPICPICGMEMVQCGSYNKSELVAGIKWYLIDGSPPEHGKIYRTVKIAA